MSPELSKILFGGPLHAGGALDFQASSATVVAAALVAVGAFALAAVGRRAAIGKAAELTLWAAALAVIVFVAAKPVWVLEEGRVEPGRLIALVDASRSMGAVEGGGVRSAEVATLLDRLGSDVEVLHFGDGLRAGPPPNFDGPETDIEGAFFALRDRVAGEKLAGVVLISDGIDRGSARRRFEAEGPGALPPEVPGPLTVYQVGTGEGLVDLAVRSVDTGGFAFLRSDVTITAELLGLGFEGRTVPATLLRDGAPVTEVQVPLDAEGRGVAQFTVRPDRQGRFTYAVRTPVYEGDAVPANNLLPVVVRVVRDRVRVLQVAGHPSWDVKFLRRFLKGDPSVDLVSFFILRTREDVVAPRYDDDELSLIEFPYQKLFTTDLGDFDLVVLQNFDPAPYFQRASNELLGNLANFVEKDGHALVMVGGDASFDDGGYRGTPIEGILPVILGPTGPTVDIEPFLPTLTDEGARHPITRLSGDDAENALIWSRLHEMDGTNLVQRAHPDAAVLLTHPTRQDASGAPLPVLAVREVGAGRTMALTVDASWRWSFSEAAAGRGNQAYLRFWKNAFRWLMSDPGTERVTVDTAKENYGVGETIRVVVRARDAGFGPLPDAEVRLVVGREGDSSIQTGRTDANGEWVLEIAAEDRGAWRAEATVTRGGAPVGEGATVFAVTARDPELDDLRPDPTFLRWLAERSGGAYHAPGEFEAPMRDPSAGRTVYDRRETPLWRAPLLLGAIAVLSGAAWWARRRSGGR